MGVSERKGKRGASSIVEVSSIDEFKIRVLILPDGKSFFLVCQPTDKIRDVRAAIRKKCCDPNDDHLFRLKPIGEGLFVLAHFGELLKDRSTIAGCDIQNGDFIMLFGLAAVPITITGTGRRCDLDMKCFDKIGDLKKRLYSLTKIPPSQQRLMHQKRILDDDVWFLFQYNLAQPFEYDDGSRENHRPHKGSTKERFVIQLDTVEPSNDSVTGARSIYIRGFDMLLVVVNIPTIPSRFPLKFKPTHTIGDMRLTIQKKIKNGLFVLFNDLKQPLDDDSITLHECGIKYMGSILVLEKESFEIDVSAPEEGPDIIRVTVTCFDTIGSLKAKLHVRTGIAREQQRLMYDGWFLDDDDRFLVDYGIATHSLVLVDHPTKHPRFEFNNNEQFFITLFTSSVYPEAGRVIATRDGVYMQEYRKFALYGRLPEHPLELPTRTDDVLLIQIAIELPNVPCRIPFVFSPTDQVGTVRQAIRMGFCKGFKEVLGQKYIETGQFVLVFNKLQLLNESRSLDECGIGHTDTIQLLEDKSFPIYLTLFEDGIHKACIRMKCFDTVCKLREEITSMSDIPPSKLHICLVVGLSWWWLEDDDDEGRRRLLVDYGIAKEVQTRVRKYTPNPLRFWNSPPMKDIVVYAGSTRDLWGDWCA